MPESSADEPVRRRLLRAQLRLQPDRPQRSNRLRAAADRAGLAKRGKKWRLKPGRAGKIAKPVELLRR